jgi:hypothetical protein
MIEFPKAKRRGTLQMVICRNTANEKSFGPELRLQFAWQQIT